MKGSIFNTSRVKTEGDWCNLCVCCLNFPDEIDNIKEEMDFIYQTGILKFYQKAQTKDPRKTGRNEFYKMITVTIWLQDTQITQTIIEC